MVSEFIQHRLHKEGKRKIFSSAQKGFVSGIQGCMEHAVLTRELIAHAQRNEKSLYMVQIDFSNAFGSVPEGLIRFNVERMGVPDNRIGCVMDVYNGCETVLSVPTGESKPIERKS
jgi:xanthine/CO dehydrogenase XdhC/CoxF family maturation factor